jgi:hypothetical protein
VRALFVAVGTGKGLGSEMGKISGSGIRNKHSGSATLVLDYWYRIYVPVLDVGYVSTSTMYWYRYIGSAGTVPTATVATNLSDLRFFYFVINNYQNQKEFAIEVRYSRVHI